MISCILNSFSKIIWHSCAASWNWVSKLWNIYVLLTFNIADSQFTITWVSATSSFQLYTKRILLVKLMSSSELCKAGCHPHKGNCQLWLLAVLRKFCACLIKAEASKHSDGSCKNNLRSDSCLYSKRPMTFMLLAYSRADKRCLINTIMKGVSDDKHVSNLVM